MGGFCVLVLYQLPGGLRCCGIAGRWMRWMNGRSSSHSFPLHGKHSRQSVSCCDAAPCFHPELPRLGHFLSWLWGKAHSLDDLILVLCCSFAFVVHAEQLALKTLTGLTQQDCFGMVATAWISLLTSSGPAFASAFQTLMLIFCFSLIKTPFPILEPAV